MIWRQHWSDVLFLHYVLAPEELTEIIPSELEIDTFDGQAWVSFVLFRLKLRPAGLPLIPGLSSLLELNVRTYVRYHDQPGIVFLRMYADNRLAINAAQLLTPLCYEPAAMRHRPQPDGMWKVACHPASGGELAVEFSVADNPRQPDETSLDAWLLERYRLFVKSGGQILAAEVEHPPWQASPVELQSIRQTLGDCLGLPLGPLQLAHHSPGVAATFRAFHVTTAGDNPRVHAVAHCAGR